MSYGSTSCHIACSVSLCARTPLAYDFPVIALSVEFGPSNPLSIQTSDNPESAVCCPKTLRKFIDVWRPRNRGIKTSLYCGIYTVYNNIYN